MLKELITKIASMQSVGQPYFPPGLFPSYRSNPLIGYHRSDTTMFFPAIIAFTLQSVRDKVEDTTIRQEIDAIVEKVVVNYPLFQNKDGLKTYNFWQTRPSKHFPNGYLFRHFEHFRIPDDVDDTALAYLTTSPTPEELRWLKEKLPLHANGTRLWIRNTYPEYRSLRAYSTWFGKNMYIEFDACVLSNLLYCIFRYQLPRNQHDEDSLTYIRSVIEKDRYLTEPFRCAHQYPRTPLIIYHVVRLLAAFDPPQLQPIREKLIRDTTALLQKAEHPMDRVILATSLLRLGERPPRIPIENYTAADFKGFYFFIAGLLTAYEHPLLYRLAINPLMHMHWICEAHNWTLLTEYQCLWESRK
ncbi:hypothetical protein [Telluribacter sp. SYSU D00476]|uniref:hypothetical protein n=1 Tax=Telluribacter sp. SYSU D00476 TaxID=2811430 RepID=UPI001FF41014|nr:hypothetical protein [Telluribacter sp. SYSU D00476]